MQSATNKIVCKLFLGALLRSPGCNCESGNLGKMTCRRQWKRSIQYAVLCALVLLVWILLSLPVLFYHLPSSSDSENDNLNQTLNQSACSSTIQYEVNTGICTSELLYSILESSSCTEDLHRSILVIESDANKTDQLINGWNLLGASQDCREEVIPFMCLYTLGLCTHTKLHIQPSLSQCEQIRDVTCRMEWSRALEAGTDLPDCSTFPKQKRLCDNLTNSTIDMSEYNFDTEILNSNGTQECSDGFYRKNGSSLCHPSCYTFKQQSQFLTSAIDVSVISVTTIGLVAAVTAIIIALLRYKRMLKFPSIFILYIVIDAAIYGFLIIFGYAGRASLFCTSQDLIQSLYNVSFFCIVSGVSLTYIIYQMSLWWLFHILSFSWKVYFPFHARSFEAKNRTKYVHLICILLGISLPVIPAATIMGKFATETDNYGQNETFLSRGAGFSMTRFPPIMCTGRNADATFYSLVLNVEIIVTFGCTALLLILWWSVVHHSESKVNDQSNFFKFSTAEKKLIVIFVYYVVLATEALVTYTISTNNSAKILKELEKYFFCQQKGHNPESPCSLSEIEKLTYPSLVILSYVLLGLLPVVNLMLIINIKEVKTILQRGYLRKTYSTRSTKITGALHETSKV